MGITSSVYGLKVMGNIGGVEVEDMGFGFFKGNPKLHINVYHFNYFRLFHMISCLCTKSFDSLCTLGIFNPSTTDSTTYVLWIQWHPRWAVQRMYRRSIFWIIALMSLYSVVSLVFPLAASFSNTVNTMEGNGKSWEGRRLNCLVLTLTFYYS